MAVGEPDRKSVGSPRVESKGGETRESDRSLKARLEEIGLAIHMDHWMKCSWCRRGEFLIFVGGEILTKERDPRCPD